MEKHVVSLIVIWYSNFIGVIFMKKLLITGFDPFGKETINPAYEAIKLIDDIVDGCEIIKLEIPTVFHESIEILEKAMIKHKPDIVLCIGQAGGRFQITPERIAINLDDASIKDNKGNQPIDTKIFEDGEAAYFANIPVKAMVRAMRENKIPASVSNTAGTFVCNHLMYGLLYKINKVEEFNAIKGGFIHVPFATEQVVDKFNTPALSLTQIAQGLTACIRACIAHETDIKDVGGKTH